MKLLNSFLSLVVAAGWSLAADNKAIQSALLDDRVVYTVPVSTNRVTTLSFPGTIDAIDGAGVSMDSKSAGQFQLAHTRGSAFVSLRALVPQATANLNVRWNHRTYVFELVESSNPLLSLILENAADQNKVQPAPELSPTGLLALLDKAKAFSCWSTESRRGNSNLRRSRLLSERARLRQSPSRRTRFNQLRSSHCGINHRPPDRSRSGQSRLTRRPNSRRPDFSLC